MRFYVVVLVFCGIYTTVYCLPNAASVQDDKYLERVREIAEELLKEKTEKNYPPNQHLEEDDLERARKANVQAKTNTRSSYYPPYTSNQDLNEDNLDTARAVNGRQNTDAQNSYDPPYTNKEKSYIQLARKVADELMAERWTQDSGSDRGRTASDALRAFNRQSRRTQMIAKQNERQAAELETLLLLASNEDSGSIQQRHIIDLTARRAKADPSCSITVDCNDNENLNIVDGIEFRTINGTCNNKNNYTWGMAGAQHRRLLPNAYHNGIWQIRQLSATSTRRPRNDVPLPSARAISNAVHATTGAKQDGPPLSLTTFYFMQFIDHDLAKTPEGEVGNRECCKEDPDKPRGFCMPIIANDPDDGHFKKDYCMDSRRSFTLFRCNDDSKFQNQINDLTAYLDASMVYGSSEEDEKRLRASDFGLLLESAGHFMPNSTRAAHLPCNVTEKDMCYEAGDERANVHPGLTTIHTVFVREHNRIAKILGKSNVDWSNDRIYEETRKIIGGEIQHIVYNELLPLLLSQAIRDKYGITKDYSYDDSIDASMTQAFSMIYRYHHLMPHELHLARFNSVGKASNFEEVKQELAFLKPTYLARHNSNGINEITLGLAVSSCPKVNRLMNSATRDLLFLDKDGNSFDLVALNIMRGREWGMQAYAFYRALCGLGNATTWEDLKNTTDDEAIEKMKSVYASVLDVDLWVGAVTERIVSGTISGPTQSCLLAMHFANLKHGDRFWYETTFTNNQLAQIKKTTLARVLCENLEDTMMTEHVFNTNSEWKTCSDIKSDSGGDMDFGAW